MDVVAFSWDWRARRRLPRKAKSYTEINSVGTSDLYELIYPICSLLDSVDVVRAQSLLLRGKRNFLRIFLGKLYKLERRINSINVSKKLANLI